MVATPTPTPTTAVNNGNTAATSEPNIINSAISANAKPNASVGDNDGMALLYAAPPQYVTAPSISASCNALASLAIFDFTCESSSLNGTSN